MDLARSPMRSCCDVGVATTTPFAACMTVMPRASSGFWRVVVRIAKTALDLTSEVFARAWLYRRRFRDEAGGSALPWLFGIARNVLPASLESRRSEAEARRKLGLEPREISVAAHAEWLLDDEGEVEAVLARLPSHERDAVALRVVESLSYRDVAAASGVPKPLHASASTVASPGCRDPEGGSAMTTLDPDLIRIGDQLQARWRMDARRARSRRRATFSAAALAGVLAIAGGALASGVLPFHLTSSSSSASPAALAKLRGLLPAGSQFTLQLDRAQTIGTISSRETGELTVVVVPYRRAVRASMRLAATEAPTSGPARPSPTTQLPSQARASRITKSGHPTTAARGTRRSVSSSAARPLARRASTSASEMARSVPRS